MKEYLSVGSAKLAELILSKSKFLSYCFNVANEEKVKDKLTELKQKHPDANHICYAYVLNSGLEKANDDGEPSGTAGLPILNVIKHNNLSNVLVAVVRYFGGVKLGAGGLTRAYSKGAGQVINEAEIIKFVLYNNYQLTLNYEESKYIKKIEELSFVKDLTKQFEEQIIINVLIKQKNEQELKTYLNNLLNKEVNLTLTKTVFKGE